MKRVFVAEKSGVPIEINAVHVEAVATPRMAKARMAVTPIPRLDTEKMVAYISVDDLEELFKSHRLNPVWLERVIAEAREGL